MRLGLLRPAISSFNDEFNADSFDALGARGFQLKAQVDAFEVLVNVEQEKRRR